MAREPFLINPPRRRKKRSLLSFNPFGRRSGKHRLAFGRNRRSLFGMRRNPFGEELMLVGLNPRRRKRRISMNPRRRRYRRNPRRRYRRNARRRHYSMNVRHRRYRHNPRRRRSYRHNPRRHRRYARNPMTSMRQIFPMALSGLIGGIAVNAIPARLGLSGIMFYGGQLAIIFGGGWAVEKWMGRNASDGWVVGSTAVALYGLMQSIVPGLFAGLSANPEIAAYPEMGPFAGYGELGANYYDANMGYGY